MNEVQLYISDTRVELFKDETITINQTIQDVRDIGSIFTDFTQQFNLPATKTNNKIFKHYYNFDINNGFDARKKVTALIKLNGLDFRLGKIKLNGVEMRDNKAYSYKVVFYGDTVTLTDLLGEDKLEDLDLSAYDADYSNVAIKAALQLNPSSNDFLIPLITLSDQLYYNSTTDTAESNNLHYNAAVAQGVYYDQLKYALRVSKIIEAIETKYNLTFSTDFFDSSVDAYYKLFLWLSRKDGSLTNGEQEPLIRTLVDGWSVTLPDNNAYMATSSVLRLGSDFTADGETLKITTNGVGSDYFDVYVYKDGVLFWTKTGLNGSNANFVVNPVAGDYTVEILTSTASLGFTKIQWDTTSSPPDDFTFDAGGFTCDAELPFIISRQIPDIKVIDFLTGLFKMFNLTAYVEDDVIVVKPLDDYYTSGTERDITKYVDITKGVVNVALPFKEVQFKYGDTKTYLADIHKRDFQLDWGGLDYDNSEIEVDGGVYKIEVPFGHMKFERLIDLADSSKTTIQWGYSTNISQQAYNGKPILFYPYLQSGGESISFRDSNVTTSEVTSYLIPLNSEDVDYTNSTANINFNNELNEYDGSTFFTGTLFENYYKTYIQDVFNTRNRITKLTAYLPLSILLNYSLADTFIINGKSYKINSVSTNLQTGKSEIELINLL